MMAKSDDHVLPVPTAERLTIEALASQPAWSSARVAQLPGRCRGALLRAWAIHVARRHPNVLLEAGWGILPRIKDAVGAIGAERVLHASDCPIQEMGSQIRLIEVLTWDPPVGATVAPADVELILGGEVMDAEVMDAERRAACPVLRSLGGPAPAGLLDVVAGLAVPDHAGDIAVAAADDRHSRGSHLDERHRRAAFGVTGLGRQMVSDLDSVKRRFAAQAKADRIAAARDRIAGL